MTMPIQSDWMKVETPSPAPVVDRENGVIRGIRVAEVGKFKDGRGHFTEESLQAGIALANAKEKGLKSRLQHDNLSDDGVGKFLGRETNHRLADGVWLCDLTFDPSAYNSPAGNLAEWTMTRAESDPESFGTSIVAKFDWFNSSGEQIDRPAMERLWNDDPGSVRWVPTMLHSNDIVDSGNATTSLLSEDKLPDAPARKATEVLDTLFSSQPRDVVERRCAGFVEKYLNHRYGVREMSTAAKRPEDQHTPDDKTDVLEKGKDVDEVVDYAQLERDRTKGIIQLCQLCKQEDKALDLIATDLTVDEVREKLSASLAADRILDDQTPPPKGEADEDSQSKSQDEIDLEEYRKNEKFFRSMGVTEEAYLKTLEVERNDNQHPIASQVGGMVFGV